MEFIKWLFIIVLSLCFLGGIINGIIDMKRGNRKSSGKGFWGILTALAILGLFDTKKKK